MTTAPDSGTLRSHPRLVLTRAGVGKRSIPAAHQSPHPPLRTTHSPERRRPKLLDQVRAAIRMRHYSLRTEEAYVHEQDFARGFGKVWMPNALQRKYPQADREWGWQWVSPASYISLEPRSGVQRRHHLHESVPQRALKEARRQVGLTKPASPLTLCVTPLGPTCWKMDTTSVRFKSCWGTVTLRLP